MVTGPRVAERRRNDSHDASIRRSRARASSPPASARPSPTRCLRPRACRSGEAQEVTRHGEPACGRLRDSRISPLTVHANVDPGTADRPQRRRLPAGHRRAGVSRSRGWRSARITIIWATVTTATRSPARTRPGRFISARTTTPPDRPPCSRSAPRWPAVPRHPEYRARLLVRRGARTARIGGVHREAARPARRSRGLSQLRHGRADAGQQADDSGRRHEPGVGADYRADERARRLRPSAAGGSVSTDRRGELQRREHPLPDVLYRRAHRLPSADRHGRQDQLRGSRSRRHLRRRHPQSARQDANRRPHSRRSTR